MARTHQTMTAWDRFGAACGAAYVVLIIVGNMMASGTSNDAHPSGAKDLADFSAGWTVAGAIGFTMEFLGFLVFVFFVGWLVHALRARGGAAAWLSGAAGIAATVTLAVKIASVMPMGAGFLDHDEISASTARILVDMNGVAFAVTLVTFGTFLAATGAAILASGFLGRLAGWLAVALGALTVLLTVATEVDPTKTNPMPFLAGLLWILVVSVRLAWKGPRTEPSEHVSAPVAVPA